MRVKQIYMHTGLNMIKRHKFSVIHWSPSSIKPVFFFKPIKKDMTVSTEKYSISRHELPWNTESISPSPLWQSLFIFRPSYQPPQSCIFKFKTSEAFLFQPHLSFISLQGEFKLLVFFKYKHSWIQIGNVGVGGYSSSHGLSYFFVCFLVFMYSLDFGLQTRMLKFTK